MPDPTIKGIGDQETRKRASNCGVKNKPSNDKPNCRSGFTQRIAALESEWHLFKVSANQAMRAQQQAAFAAKAQINPQPPPQPLKPPQLQASAYTAPRPRAGAAP